MVNIVPNYCEFVFEFRNVAAEDPRGLLQRLQGYADKLSEEMRSTDPDCRIEINITTEYPGLSTASDSEVIAFVKNLAQPLAKNTSTLAPKAACSARCWAFPPSFAALAAWTRGTSLMNLSILIKSTSAMPSWPA